MTIQEEIASLKKSYRETQRQITSGTLPRHVTNVGDKQAMKLNRIRELERNNPS